jgi:hypothetical protein
MTVVLDATAAAALASPEDDPNSIVGAAIMNEICYMTPAAVVAMYGSVHDRIGRDAADYWLRFVTSGKDVRVDETADAEFLEMSGHATLIARKLISTGMSAALANRRGVELLTNVEESAELERGGLCRVRRF